MNILGDAERQDNLKVQHFDIVDKQADNAVQQIYISDVNPGSYSQGEVRFNLQSVSSNMLIPKSLKAIIPCIVTSSSTAYTSATRMAFKKSFLTSIIREQLLDGTGDTIQNLNDSFLYNLIQDGLEIDD